jgi:CRISPR-associated protein Cmr3
VREGVLYQTKHIRPRKEVAIALDVQGLPEDFPNQVMLRLGAEGRSAAVQKMSESSKSLELPKNVGNTFALYLLTPLHRSDTPKDQPLPSFEKPKPENSKVTYWLGDIKGVAIKLHGAITGKMQREGGWDLANHRPKAVTNLIPAGSVFFCELVSQPATDAEREAILKQLHLKHHGAMTEYGYGQLAVGVWNDERI